jgi:hypothetical protein
MDPPAGLMQRMVSYSFSLGNGQYGRIRERHGRWHCLIQVGPRLMPGPFR